LNRGLVERSRFGGCGRQVKKARTGTVAGDRDWGRMLMTR
jgi:hypothetical protein